MRLEEETLDLGPVRSRVWSKGTGRPLAFLAGFGGTPRWPEFLDPLASEHRVLVPALPGFPGATGHHELDDIVDWVAATLDILEAAGFEQGVLVGASVGGMIAAEIAALCRPMVERLVLCAPLGLFDEHDPVADVFAVPPAEIPAFLSAAPEKLAGFFARPEGEDELEWTVLTARAAEAAARLLWPLGDRGLWKRLHRISAPTLLVWGAEDRVVPRSYAQRFAREIRGPVKIETVPGAGHLSYLDRPAEVASRLRAFLRA
ncbi:MAG: alpha/beta hydrolase [Candidatus Binatia bacterium]|nr:MAG: alpha/beta hydrolase [Candidatus Binatia bacterium]